ERFSSPSSATRSWQPPDSPRAASSEPAPGDELLCQCCAQALNARLRLRDRLQILHEGDVLRVMGKGQCGQVSLVSGRPRGLARVAATVTQKQRLQLLPGLKTGAYGIDARAAQVPDRLVALVRLHPIARPPRYLRGRHHRTAVAAGPQFPGERKSAGPRLGNADGRGLGVRIRPDKAAIVSRMVCLLCSV